MFSRSRAIRVLTAFISVATATPAAAWYGPGCYSSKARQISLTLPAMTGEAPGDVKVSFDDNDGKAKLVAVRASTKVKNAHEIVLSRDDDSRSGVFGVIVTSGRSSFGYKFELEFRDTPDECTGAIVKVSDKFSGDIGNETVALKAVAKPSAPKHKKTVEPVEAPADSGSDSATRETQVIPSEGAEPVGPARPSAADTSPDASKADSGKDPVKPDSAKPDSAKADSAKPDSVKVDSAKPEAVNAEKPAAAAEPETEQRSAPGKDSGSRDSGSEDDSAKAADSTKSDSAAKSESAVPESMAKPGPAPATSVEESEQR